MTDRAYVRVWWLLVVAIPAAGCRTASPSTDTATVVTVPAVFRDEHLEADLPRSFDDVDRCTRAVLAFMGLEVTPSYTEHPDRERAYEARNDDRMVHLKVEQQTATTTHVSVSSRVARADDVGYASEILERILRHH
jgi:hypothetical protein